MDEQVGNQVMDQIEARQVGLALEAEGPEQVLAWALEKFGDRLAICSSFQVESCALIDMAWRIDRSVRVFTIDTGRLPDETHDLVERMRERYGLAIEIFMPEHQVVQKMVSELGTNLFYRDTNLRLLCCQVRKVLPLKRALVNYDAWVTGLRRDQSATRSEVRKLEIDDLHGGIVKLNPLADWTEREVWDYVRRHDVPYNALYDRGYRSIGCAPCTRAVPEGAGARSGRWWWETDALKECGMHCAVESGGFQRQLSELLGVNGHNVQPPDDAVHSLEQLTELLGINGRISKGS